METETLPAYTPQFNWLVSTSTITITTIITITINALSTQKGTVYLYLNKAILSN